MDGLTRETCAFAADGTCKFPHEACEECKVDLKTSEIRGKLCVGAYTFEDVERMQKGLPPMYGWRDIRVA